MLKNLKWLFFDMGSTLIDETICYERRLRHIADFAGIEYEKIYAQALELYKNNKKGDLELFKLHNVEKLKWNSEYERLYADTEKCLRILSEKYNIGIIANQNIGSTARLEKFGILKYIDLVVASAEEGVAKPDKRIFEIALERANCKPNEAVMIGDRIDNDIIPAKAIGMKTIWIRQGFGGLWSVQNESETADETVENLTELCDVIE